jgi:excisionase family DNA binding protein
LITPMAYSVVDAARVLGIGKSKLYELVKQGEIETIKIGSRTLVLHDQLAAFVDRQREAA